VNKASLYIYLYKSGPTIGSLNDVSLFRRWLYFTLRWDVTDWLMAQQKLFYQTPPESELQPPEMLNVRRHYSSLEVFETPQKKRARNRARFLLNYP
tara:strand:+ start:341 stop:628 length:288 start_codon:yes stop_codon:yes gene_type:complete